jgi:hypothetical protein
LRMMHAMQTALGPWAIWAWGVDGDRQTSRLGRLIESYVIAYPLPCLAGIMHHH